MDIVRLKETKKKYSQVPTLTSEILYSSDSDCEYRIVSTIMKIKKDNLTGAIYECNLCNARFRKNESLQSHLKRHVGTDGEIPIMPDVVTIINENTESKIEICQKCGESYVSTDILKHARSCPVLHRTIFKEESDEKAIDTCHRCGKYYIVDEIEEHIKICYKTTNDETSMDVEMKDELEPCKDEPSYIEYCPKCNIPFSNFEIEDHIKICSPIKITAEVEYDDDNSDSILITLDPSMSQCQQCNEIYVLAEIEEHVKVCKKVQSLSFNAESLCPICGKLFLTHKLKTHMKIHGEKTFLCSICGMGHNTSSALKRHTQTHTKEYKYECQFCQKKCSTNHTLKEHLRIHSGIKEFACSLCDKSFTQQNGLKQHMMHCHSGVKKQGCEYCDRRFHSKQHLKEHLKMHTKERAYTCEICSSKFTYSNTLHKHMKKFHADALNKS